MSSIAELLEEASGAVQAAADLAALDAVRVHYLGKKGVFTAQLRELGKLPPDQIRAAGQAINSAKESLTARSTRAARRSRASASRRSSRQREST